MHEHQGYQQGTLASNEHIDPVCGMTVVESPTAIKTEYKGKTYYFCAPGCKAAFEKDPEKYLQSAS
jgi:YHS domain-containing protein